MRPPGRLRWRLRLDPPASGAANMALDHLLALDLNRELEEEPGGFAPGVLRLYRWARPTVSFGRNQPAAGLWDPAAARSLGVDFVRRPTGGRAVLHDEELTYAVVVPVEAVGGVRNGYRLLNQALLAALEVLGVPAGLAGAPPGGRQAPLDAGPCFLDPAEGEVVAASCGSRADPRKLVGSAQRRFGSVLLQHGSVPLGRSRVQLRSLAVAGADRSAPARTMGVEGEEAAELGLEWILGRKPSWEEAAAAAVDGFRRMLPGRWPAHREGGGGVPATVREGVAPLSREGLEAHYASSSWTWRM